MEFEYLAYGADKKAEHGTQIADTAEMASRLLASRGLKLLSLKTVPAFMPRWENLVRVSRVPVRTLIIFTRQWALLLESGTDTVSALELLRLQLKNRFFQGILSKIASDLRRGQKLSTALSRHPSVFSKIYVNSVSVGERTGGMDNVLRQLADYIEKEDKAARSLKTALRYPAIVCVVAAIVIIVMAIVVLPAFNSLYSSLGIKLPAITQAMSMLVTWLTDYGLAFLGLVMAGGALGFLYIKTPNGKFKYDVLLLKLPLLGRIIHLNELILCCRSMSMLHHAGLPVAEILTLSTECCTNSGIKQALTDVHREVLKGEGLAKPMAKNTFFLPMMVQMVSVGETTGNLDTTLKATAESFETEAAEQTHALVELIQPAITIGLGIVVSLIALSLVSAMYSIYGINI